MLLGQLLSTVSIQFIPLHSTSVGLEGIASFCGIQFQPREKTADASSGHGHTRVSCSVIKMNGVSICSDGLPARKDNIANVASSFLGSLWTEHPRVSSLQADVWIVQIEKREAEAVDTSGRCLPDP
jgi:hypothetical protein